MIGLSTHLLDGSACFQRDQEKFVDTMTELVENRHLSLPDLLNFDQTMVRLVSPMRKTVSPIGVKEVAFSQSINQ